MKLDTGTSDFDKDYDKILPNGMTRRQILEKMLADPRPGLRGEEKWAAIRALQEAGHRQKEQQQADDLNELPTV